MSDLISTFEKLSIKEPILRGIYAYGYETPAPIQIRTIPIMSEKKDIVAQSQSGTGKTGAFVVGVLQNIDETSRRTQALIISPTRELAIQTKMVAEEIGRYTQIKIGLCVGGTPMNANKRDILNAHVLAATPGRLIGIMQQQCFYASDINMLVLDEADVLLSGNFHEQTKMIISKIPKTAQVCIFSATFTPEILDLTKLIMNDPEFVLIKTEELTLEGIKQFIVDLDDHESWKFDTLLDIFGMMNITQCIVYVNSIPRAEALRKMLEGKNCAVAIIHSDMMSSERNSVLSSFRHGKARILISTDLLSRGIDIQQLSVVINYDFPRQKDTYIHRIGRSGRYGRKGVAINLITRHDYQNVRMIEQFYDTKLAEMPANLKQFF